MLEKKYFVVSESIGVFWVRNLIATLLETLREFSAIGLGPVGTCPVVRRALPASSTGLETSGFGFSSLLPSPVFMYVGEGLLSVADLSQLWPLHSS